MTYYRLLSVTCTLVALVSCVEVDSVIVSLPPCGYSPASFAIGDTVRATADALAATPVFVGSLLFSSSSQPNRFRWTVEPASNATVVARGMIVVQRAGSTRLLAIAEGVVGSAEFIGQVPTATVVVDAPTRALVGDTVVVQFTAFDSAGAPIPAPFAAYLNVQQSQLEKVYEPEPFLDRQVLVAKRVGQVDLDWCYARRTGSFQLTIAEQ